MKRERTRGGEAAETYRGGKMLRKKGKKKRERERFVIVCNCYDRAAVTEA